jgi:hypothetical protein
MLNSITKIRFSSYYKGGKTIFGFRQAGYWNENTSFIDEKDSIQLQKALKLITKSEPIQIGGKDIIYATKASDIPRFKLKEFIKEKNLKKTSRAKMANIFIMNKGMFLDLIKALDYGDHYFVNEEHAICGHRLWGEGGNWETCIKQFNSYKDRNNYWLVEKDRSCWKDMFKDSSLEQLFKNNTHTTKGTLLSVYREQKLIDLLSIIVDNVNDIISGKKKIVFDEDLFVELNKEGIELDDEYLQTLRDMLFSKDNSNVKLGFEMMSNLVLNESTILSISFLLNELIHTTSFRPSYYTNNNTNLKALLKLLKTKGIVWERDWKTFGTGLRKNFKTGKEGAIVKKFLLDNINREFKLNNSAAESLVDIVFSTEVQEVNLIEK